MIGRRPHIDLEDAVVVVTGASSGIGRATAVELAGRGAKVVLAARSSDALDDAVRECEQAGGEAIAVVTDVSVDRDVDVLLERAVDRYGRVDAWINVAGVMAYGRFDEVPHDLHRQVMQTNLLGPIRSASAVLPHFRDRGHGSLVNVASLYGEITTPYVTAYTTSKFALVGLSRALRRDMKEVPGVEVSCVLPGSVDTPIFRHAANRTGRAVRAIPPVVAPHRVVRAIVRCLERPRAEVRVGSIGRAIAFGQGLAPWLYDRVVQRAMKLLAFRREPAPNVDGNVFEPTGEWYRIEGGWSRTWWRRIVVATMVVAVGSSVVRLADGDRIGT